MKTIVFVLLFFAFPAFAVKTMGPSRLVCEFDSAGDASVSDCRLFYNVESTDDPLFSKRAKHSSSITAGQVTAIKAIAATMIDQVKVNESIP